MSKGLSLWFAFSSIMLLAVTAIMISYSGWLASLLFVVSVANIGWGFVIRAKKERREGRTTSETAS
ncbi:MAG TPA: hypothetical protein DEF35_04165 [Paenibacillus sp.]|jgi:ABC-type bacteriocin/lantibiotic exporter with double-glycine peptidase domain|uniref:hypothetical protein n=1 Tax=Paenibacillus TaxID=44249 RepID=UPI000BA06E26|nr:MULTISPECIES: hypothetical protein [Paenibacillus]OZQ70771.1 hypothetical protein CA599_11855 [Paenibacillus taichungensis]HBU80821.1 hypothetical protein [Paenibacillus sp.]